MAETTNPATLFDEFKDFAEPERSNRLKGVDASEAVKLEVWRRFEAYDQDPATKARRRDAMIDQALRGMGEQGDDLTDAILGER